MMKRVLAVTLSLLLFATGCVPRPVAPRRARPKPSVPAEVKPLLATPGLHKLPDGRDLAVGVLHFRDVEGGFWAVFETRLRDQEASTVVVIANPRKLGDLQPLDGQYVAVAGRIEQGSVSIRQAGPEMTADWIARVSDLVDAERTVGYGTGVHVRPDGRVFALGWLAGGGRHFALLSAKPGSSKAATIAVVAERAFRVIPTSALGRYIEMFATLEVTRSPAPVIVPETSGMGWSDGPGSTTIVDPPEWWDVEPPGLKDLPRGRKRLVGVLERGATGFVLYLGEPFEKMRFPQYVVEPRGTSGPVLEKLVDEYVALTGSVDATPSERPGVRFGGLGRFLAESASIVSTRPVTVHAR